MYLLFFLSIWISLFFSQQLDNDEKIVLNQIFCKLDIQDLDCSELDQVCEDPVWQQFVTCNDTEILFLNVSINNIGKNFSAVTIPTQIGNILSLTGFIFDGFQFVGTIPTQIGKLINLDTLSISHSSITGTLPTQIMNLEYLIYFVFPSNQLNGSIPTQIGNLIFLNDLVLSNNQLTGTIPTQIGNIGGLSTLDFAGNKLTGTIPTQIGNILYLRTLNLENNKLNGTIPNQFRNLEALEYLYLSKNEFSGNFSLYSEPGVLQDFRIMNILDTQLFICDTNVLACYSEGLFSRCSCGASACETICCWDEYDLDCPPCPNGYKRLQPNGPCNEDINECDIDNGGCENYCKNTKGSFYCICTIGQYLDEDNICQDKTVDISRIIGIVLGITLAAILLAALFGTMLFRYYNTSRELNALPSELNWSFRSATSLFALSIGWYKHRNFFVLDLKPNTSHWSKVVNLFLNETVKKKVKLDKILAIYSPSLVSQFLLRMNIMKRNPDTKSLFEDSELRNWIIEQYWAEVNKYGWSKKIKTPIIPVFHGTDFNIATMICENGFANLSLIDQGYYGKGIYFTTDINYAFSYCFSKPQPTIIISFVLPGNPYPIIESPKDDINYCGSPVPIMKGYNSHYVRTKDDGFPVTKPEESYDEIVVGQESQIVPAFLLRFDHVV